MAGTVNQFCPDDRMSGLLAVLGRDETIGINELDSLLEQFPDDPRLVFLKGSLLAGSQDYAAARTYMRRAVDLAPEFHVARFQLGFLLLTSGEPFAAQEAWGPLHALPKASYLRIFVDGLCHLIRDEFDDTVRVLKEGIAANQENPAMNRDMQLIIDEVLSRQASSDGGGGPVSSVDLLLQQAALRSTKH